MQLFVLNENARQHFKGLYDETLFLDADKNMIMLGAIEGTEPVGILIASIYFEDIALQWIYVREDMRRKKIAGYLVKALIKTTEKCGVKNIYSFFPGDNRTLGIFLKSEGFAIKSNPGWCSFEGKLSDLHVITGVNRNDYTMSSFMTIDKNMLAGLNETLQKGQTLVGVPLALDPRDFSPFSCCSIEDGKISSLMIVQTSMQNDEDIISFPWIYVGDSAISSASAIYNATLGALKASYPPDTKLKLDCINPKLQTVVSKIMPMASVKEIYMAVINLKQ